MSRVRPGRVRTKRSNHRKPLLISRMAPQDLNLRENELRAIVCPDCQTWRRLMGETTLKIREHGDDLGSEFVRCSGSNQLVVLDVSVEEWGEQLLHADTTAMHRRSTTVRRKPKRTAAPAVTQMQPVAYSAAAAWEALDTHRRQCAACRGEALDGHGRRIGCPDGQNLVATYVRVLSHEPALDRFRKETARDHARSARQATRRAARKNSAAWAGQASATTDTARLTKRAGTAVEELNNSRRVLPGSASEFRDLGVPLEPPRISA